MCGNCGFVDMALGGKCFVCCIRILGLLSDIIM